MLDDEVAEVHAVISAGSPARVTHRAQAVPAPAQVDHDC